MFINEVSDTNHDTLSSYYIILLRSKTCHHLRQVLSMVGVVNVTNCRFNSGQPSSESVTSQHSLCVCLRGCSASCWTNNKLHPYNKLESECKVLKYSCEVQEILYLDTMAEEVLRSKIMNTTLK